MTGEDDRNRPRATNLRGPVETLARAGWRLHLVDLPRLLELADPGPVDVVIDPPLPRPVRSLRITLRTQAGARHLEAVLHYGRTMPGPGVGTLGNDPIGALLRRRLDAGDERAVRIVAGLQGTAEWWNRLSSTRHRTGPSPSTRTERFVDAQTALETTVTSAKPSALGAGTIRLSAATRSLTAAGVAAFFDAVTHIVRRLGGTALSGDFTLRAHPRGDRVSLDHVGGLDDVVAQFRDIAVSFQHPDAMVRWGAQRPQGILLYGPAGPGNTTLARALAEEIGATLREIRTPEILDKWLGASERNLRRIFAQARQYRTPTVLLFDEFDSIIGYAGAGTDSGSHAINAVAGLFKQEMNNLIESNPQVIVVATTNFPDAIDASLIRSGRFDVKIEIPRPDAQGRAQILGRMISSLIAGLEVDGFQMFHDDIDLDELAGLTDGMVGADLREVLRRAQLAKAMGEARSGRPPGPIDAADLRAAIAEMRLT